MWCALCHAAVVVIVCGCARKAKPDEPTVGLEMVGEASEVGPRVSEGRGDGPSADSSTVGNDHEHGAAGERVETSGVWRADGRPTWWFDGVLEESGRVSVVSEAIARDVVNARRMALESARATLRRAVGEALGERVDAALVRRLAGDGPGRERYVGYVRLSCARGG